MKKTPLILLFSFSFTLSQAQTVTSPYSILGIGDVETREFTRYFITANAAIARRDEASINMANPASLSALPLKTMHFDLSFLGRSSVYTLPSTGDRTAITKDFTFKRGTLAFKVNQKTGFAFGLQPYSTMNYQYVQTTSITDGNDSYSKFTEGSGGINQFFFSIGKSYGKHISMGVSASWLFGSLQRNTTYYSDALSLNIVKADRDFYTGGLFKAGLQLYSDPGRHRDWKQHLGLTGSISTRLNGQLSTSYTESSTLLTSTTTGDRRFSLPLQGGIGYSATYKNRLTLSFDAVYDHWKYQELEYKKSFTAPAYRFSAGMEYSFKQKAMTGLLEKSFVGWGVHAGQSYMRINNQTLKEYAANFGAGISPARSFSLYGAVEIGKRGSLPLSQIKENFTRFTFGVTVKDIWIGTKKYGRYY